MASLGLGRALMTLGSGVRDFGNTALSLEQQRRAEAERAAERAENQRRWEVALSMTPGVVPIAGEPTEGIHRDSILADPGMPLRRREPQFAGAVTPETVTPELSRPEPRSDIRQIHLPGIGKALQTPVGMTRLTDDLAFNPNWQTEQQIAAETRARAAEDAARAEVVESLVPALEANYGDQARSIAEAIARGVNLSDLAYQPLTREQMLADAAATRPPQRTTFQRIPLSEGGGVFDPSSGTITGGGAPPPEPTIPLATAEARTRILMGLPRAEQALAEIERFMEANDGGPPVSSWLDRTTPTRAFQTDEVQAFRAAGERLASAILRTESGAATPDSEVRRYAQQFIPQPTDKPETARQKLEVLRATVERMRALGGVQGTYSPDNPFR